MLEKYKESIFSLLFDEWFVTQNAQKMYLKADQNAKIVIESDLRVSDRLLSQMNVTSRNCLPLSRKWMSISS